MRKEIIIVIVIAIAIIITDTLTQKYTKNSFLEINNKLDEIKEVGKILENEKELKENENTSDEYINNKRQLEEKIDDMQNIWRKTNYMTSFYIEHDELEKVNSAMTKFKTYFELEEYGEAIPELENCKYILQHIKDKSAMKIINLF